MTDRQRGLRALVSTVVGSCALNVDLHVRPGEVVALMGPNGAGKTTLLRALAGLEPLRAGEVRLDGRILDAPAAGIRVPVEQRRAGVVFQDPLLFPHLSAVENVAFGLRARGVRAAAARSRGHAWLERVGLADRASQRPAGLSGGQAQRVALARALAIEPDLLLLDEPLAALDVETRVTVRRELHAHLRTYAGVCLLVTHDPVDALALADRLVVLEEGHVVQTGSFADVTQHPRSAWTANLVGLNLYRGMAAGRSVTLDSGRELFAAVPAAGEVFVAVHPRTVALYRQRPVGTPRNVWSGTVDALDSRGDSIRVHLDAHPPVVAEVTPEAVAELQLAAGGIVYAAVKASEVMLYPA